ncbi:ribose 5-phosphate isomerase A [Cytobacillus sp. NCCP-133]|uniref:ribose 5-phosphate isomerase A n=1 Tax=Cytobacillus sp. NCCP-133 TaxID=766848 RepID=UPI00223216D2|nr:ribose 5-phosphate isomerase A [Cytobacillus sp. NCCP-133]GLB61066.1 hypothetical protein NCCP133_31970 [Cytobacillus sp. NCCP-133]
MADTRAGKVFSKACILTRDHFFVKKIVDANSDKLIIIVDESKMVEQLGNFPLPVEVVPSGWELTAKQISDLGAVPKLRKRDGDIFISNNGNYILDCKFKVISNPQKLHSQLKQLIGVVETGLFIGMTDLVIVGSQESVKILENKQ